MSETPKHQIRAFYNDETIRVYQAYSDRIADSALANQTFVSPPFKLDRMTWIKPSFLWMMYRSGWGMKDGKPSKILAIDITRAGFEWALDHSCLSRPSKDLSPKEWKQMKRTHPVRIQWDPERNPDLEALDYRAIQIGLSNEAVVKYLNEWITCITDITPLTREIHALVQQSRYEEAKQSLPNELAYLLEENTRLQINADLCLN
ncbi:MAG: DUF4291 domain-containing protein [Geitlerinemataceae cyanobacterium]